MRRAIWIALACTSLIAETASAVRPRTWVDSSGDYTRLGNLIELTDDQVVRIEKTNGQVARIVLGRLSDGDQKIVGNSVAGMGSKLRRWTWEDHSLARTFQAAFDGTDTGQGGRLGIRLWRLDGTHLSVPEEQLRLTKEGQEYLKSQLVARAGLALTDSSLEYFLRQPAIHSFDRAPLDDVLKKLGISRRYDPDIDVAKREQLITLKPGKGSLGDALQQALKEVGLVWLERSNAVFITEQSKAADSLFETRVFRLAAGEDAVRFLQEALATVEPTRWEQHGGRGRAMVLGKDLIVVYQAQDIQRKLQQFGAERLRICVEPQGYSDIVPQDSPQLVALVQPTQVEFIETPLSDILEYVSDYTGVKFRVDEDAFDDAKLDPTFPVTCEVSGVQMEQALQLAILDERGLVLVADKQGFILTTPKAQMDKYSADWSCSCRLAGTCSPSELADCVRLTADANVWDKAGGPGKITISAEGVLRLEKVPVSVHAKVEKFLATLGVMENKGGR
jgi:hypothetical protein